MVRIRRVLSVWCVTLAVGWAAAAVAGPAENLVDAASRDDAGAVQALLGEGVDVNAKDPYRGTALEAASRAGHLDIVQALLAKGAEVNAKDSDGETALMGAARSGHADVMRALLDKGADVNAQTINGVGATALILAVENRHFDAAKALLAKGADVNARLKDGLTVLMMASEPIPADGWPTWPGQLDVVQALLARGADVNAKMSAGGETALTEAKNPEVRALLVRAGAKP